MSARVRVACLLLQLLLAASGAGTADRWTPLRVSLRRLADICAPSSGRTCGSGETSLTFNCSLCRPCRCDDSCFRYGDCCPDVRFPPVWPESTDEVCVEPVVGSRKRGWGYFMVSHCPAAFRDPAVADLCAFPRASTNLTLFQPVTSIKTLKNYRNVFCARCHDEPDAVLSHWPKTAKCVAPLPSWTMADILRGVETNACSVVFEPATERARPCYGSRWSVRRCNATEQWRRFDPVAEWACEKSPLTFQNLRDVFCSLCNNRLRCLSMSRFEMPPPFSVIMNFNPQLEHDALPQTKLRSENFQCESGHLFDGCRGRCTKIYCSEGRRVVNDSCRSVFASVRGLRYKAAVSLQPADSRPSWMTDEDLAAVSAQLQRRIAKSFQDFNVTQMALMAEIRTSLPGLPPEPPLSGNASRPVTRMLLWIELVVGPVTDLNSAESALVATVYNPWFLRVGGAVTEFDARHSQQAQVFAELFQSERSSSRRSTTNSTVVLLRGFRTGDPFVGHRKLVSPFLLCAQVQLSENETGAVDAAHRLPIPAANITVRAGEYQRQDGGDIRLCARRYLDATSCKTPEAGAARSEAFIAVSIFSSVVALLFLALTFAFYSCFAQLRSLPGKNNMALVSMLFLSQCFFVFGAGQTSTGWGCEVLGICLHFCLLAALLWMNVCSIHMYRVFNSSTNQQPTDQFPKTYPVYCVYVFATAAAIVSACIAEHLVSTAGRTAGYGGHVCYLSSPRSIGIYFALPTALVVVTNIALFVAIINFFRKLPKLDGEVNRDRNYAYANVKLSTLTGLHWIIALLAEVCRWEALYYIFVILNGFQGLFLFVSFICNRRVWLLLKKKFDSDSDALERPLSTSVFTTLTKGR